MADYKKLFPHILAFEGGLANDPDDSGGLTNKGLTYANYCASCQEVLGRKPAKVHFLQLSDEEIGLFFKKLYWDKMNADNIPSQAIADILVDWFWGSWTVAAKELQRCLFADFGLPLLIDGEIGPKTIDAITKVNEKAFIEKYNARRLAFYEDLAGRRPKDKKFLKGWKRRANTLYEKYLKVLA